jgi:hypothetical protein
MGAYNYERRELTRVLDAGPAEGETLFRLQVSGKESTKYLNITAAQLKTMIETLCAEKWEGI